MGAAFACIADALLQLARRRDVDIRVLLHPNPRISDAMRATLAGEPRIHHLQPLGHRGMIEALQQCAVVLSDSGGIQEEAPALDVPLLVLREKTERPEAIVTGNMKLVGTWPDTVLREVPRLLDDPLERSG